MSMKKFGSSIVSLLLVLCMLIGMVPMSVFAAEVDNDLTAALAEAKAYIDGITINNSSNDPETVVKNFKTHFTWDNEKRENGKDYLFDWSYYNGVVFEGLLYAYEATGEQVYLDYVEEYMSSLLNENGGWAFCTNSGYTDKYCAGYNSTHGADCYKTASMLMDMYELTGEARYLTMAKTLYGDLDNAAASYSLPNAGNNYRHTWASDSTPDLWLDGLYMILPFRAEYAKYSGDTAELEQIVSRLQWVSDNMYDSSKGLFYHAADSATSNSGTYWLRSIGWYAAAIVDVMDSMEGENLEAMKKQLVKLVDGMKACQNSTNGMWLNNMNAAQSSTNPYETSGTALVCYAVMKAVNNGWLDESYADMALLAFKGICDEKLSGSTLTDICFKGAPGKDNSTFYDNEGKGVGPFIMLYAEILKYTKELTKEISYIMINEGDGAAYKQGDTLLFELLVTYDDKTTATVTQEDCTVTVTDLSGTEIALETAMNTVGQYAATITYEGVECGTKLYFTVSEEENFEGDITSEDTLKVVIGGVQIESVTASTLTGDALTAVAEKVSAVLDTTKLVAYDISVEDFEEGTEAEVTIPMPEGANASCFCVFYVGDNVLEPMNGHPNADGTYTFTTTHFSTYVGGERLAETSWVTYNGESYYEKVTSMSSGTPYVITRTSSTYYALNRASTESVGSQSVSIEENSDGTYSIETVEDSMVWYMDSDGHIYCTVDDIKYYLNAVVSGSMFNRTYTLTVSTSPSSEWTVVASNSNVTIRTSVTVSNWNGTSSEAVYLRYDSGFSLSTSSNTLSLYSKHAQPGGQARLTGTLETTVKVSDGTTRDQILSAVTVEWDSNSDGVADSTIALSNCTITGSYNNAVADDYSLAIAYNGKTLGAVTIHVTDKAIVSVKLYGNDDITVKQNGVVDYSDIYLEVLYEGETEPTRIEHDKLTFSPNVDTAVLGTTEVEISYAGEVRGTVNVTVSDNPYAGLDTATEYPVYPAPGSVRMNKYAKEMDFDNTGTVQIELNAAGISMKTGVDVILVTDLSNSMAWAAGGRTDATSHEATKMYDLAQSVNSFADVFLAANADGTATKNTMTLVTFGGYDADYTNKVYTAYADPTQTLILGSNDAAKIKDTINNIRVLADDALNRGTSSTGYYLSFDGGTTYGENYGNTNYDHAFMQTAAAITELKNKYTDYAETGRQIYVVFMTDGAPSNYDGVYYNYKTGDRADVNSTWVNANGNEVTYTMGNNNAQYQAGPWFQYIAGGTYNASTGTIPGNPLYWADQVYNTAGVADIINVGFDLDNGGFSSMTFTEADGRPLAKVLEKMVTGKTLEVYNADNQSELTKIYADLASKIRKAGTDAQVTDVIQEEFTLQLNAFGKKNDSGVIENPTDSVIEVRSYELWLPSETSDMNLIGTRKRYNGDTLLTDPSAEGYENGTYNYDTIEKVTFTYNSDGSVSGAYSTVVDEGKTNIYSETNNTVTINAKYFTYTKDANDVETFKWKIGDITDDEISLTYYAYLENSMGEDGIGVEKQFYYTNEKAYLEYIDVYGDYANREYVRPQVYWGGASTAYEFYLVNEAGKPCNYDGVEIPFANRIVIVPPEYEYLNLNTEGTYYSKEIVAAKVLPAGYKLYDDSASYEVHASSGTQNGYLHISTPVEGKVQTTIEVSATKPSYIQSHVAFGVIYNILPSDTAIYLTPETVVIDYGKPMNIDISNNKTVETDGNKNTYSVELVGFSRYFADQDLTEKFSSTSSIASYDATYGTFTVYDANKRVVTYTPNRMIEGVDQIFCVLKLTEVDNEGNTFYMVEPLTVIPATIMYYETDFAGGVFTTNGFDEDKTDGTEADGPQDDGTIGQNTYGYDKSYDNDAKLSNASSEFAKGAGVNTTTATFSFTGTGFDLISRTGAEQGLIKVQVFKSGSTTPEKTVSVLNKSESSLELYQIPVVSINGLGYGTYDVKIGVDVKYENEKFPVLYRGNEFYFDAIRVYDPAKGNATAEAAYAADGEANATLDEVRAQLIKVGTFEAIASGSSTPGMVYVDSTYTGDNADRVAGNANVTDYTKIGPNNEVYLSNGQAVAFKVEASAIPASFDLGVKSIKGDTAGLKAVISDKAGNAILTVEKDIKSSTVQFINLLTDSSKASVLATDGAYVVITNTANGVLSITDLKTAFSVNASGVAEVDFTVDEAVLPVAARILAAAPNTDTPEIDEPEVDVPEIEEPEVIEPNYDILSASFDSDTVKTMRTTTMTVVTTQDVAKLRVRGGLWNTGMKYVDNEDGTRTWTVTFWVIPTGNQRVTVTGYGADGTAGQPMTASVKVKLF